MRDLETIKEVRSELSFNFIFLSFNFKANILTVVNILISRPQIKANIFPCQISQILNMSWGKAKKYRGLKNEPFLIAFHFSA